MARCGCYAPALIKTVIAGGGAVGAPDQARGRHTRCVHALRARVQPGQPACQGGRQPAARAARRGRPAQLCVQGAGPFASNPSTLADEMMHYLPRHQHAHPRSSREDVLERLRSPDQAFKSSQGVLESNMNDAAGLAAACPAVSSTCGHTALRAGG